MESIREARSLPCGRHYGVRQVVVVVRSDVVIEYTMRFLKYTPVALLYFASACSESEGGAKESTFLGGIIAGSWRKVSKGSVNLPSNLGASPI